MSGGAARRGRRDNGLEAVEYAAAADVDPRVGEHLLDVLALAGIAAYLQPTADLHPVTRTTTLPSRPTDRLYVDRRQLGEARGYVSRLGADKPAARSTGGSDSGPDRTTDPAPDPATDRAPTRPDTALTRSDAPPTRPGAPPIGPDPTAASDDTGSRPDPTAAGDQLMDLPADPTRDAGPVRDGATPEAGAGANAGPDAPTTGEPPDPAPARPAAMAGTGGQSDSREEFDARWAELMSDYFASPTSGALPPWPVAEDVGDDQSGGSGSGRPGGAHTDDEPAAGPGPRAGRRSPEAGPPSLLDALDADFDDSDDEGYTPPPPPPLPRLSRNAGAAVLLVLAGFILLLWPTLLDIGTDLSIGLGFCAILGGFVMLIWRLRAERSEDGDPDDGAVV